jgi:hypothetical protein
MVEFSRVEEVDLSEYRAINMANAHGTLGLITVNGDVFLVVVNGASKVATVRPGESIQRIHSVGFCEYTREARKGYGRFCTGSKRPGRLLRYSSVSFSRCSMLLELVT